MGDQAESFNFQILTDPQCLLRDQVLFSFQQQEQVTLL